MKKNRITESQFSQSQLKMYQNMYDTMPEDEKISWKKAIEQCINEYSKSANGERSVSSNFKFSFFAGTFALSLIIVGIKLNIIELVLMGAGAIAWLTKFTMQDWKIIIDCARKKKGLKTSADNSSEMSMNESIKKQKIRLTESELVGLIKKIIKEDEMMSTSMSHTGSKFCTVKIEEDCEVTSPIGDTVILNGKPTKTYKKMRLKAGTSVGVKNLPNYELTCSVLNPENWNRRDTPTGIPGTYSLYCENGKGVFYPNGL